MTAIYALVATASHAWTDAAVVVPALAAAAMTVGFLVLEARHRNPLMPLRMLRIRSLMISSVVRGFLFMGMYGVFFFGALELSHRLAFEPLAVGLAFLPQTTVVAVLSLGVTAKLVKRFPAREAQSMEKTIAVQVPGRMSKEKRVKIEKTEEDGFYVKK